MVLLSIDEKVQITDLGFVGHNRKVTTKKERVEAAPPKVSHH